MKKIDWRGFSQPPKKGIHKNESPCQDSVNVKDSEDIIVAVLSDGLGSLKHSEIASQTITATVADYLSEYDYRTNEFDKEDFAQKIISLSRDAIIEKCNSCNFQNDEMDCTLLFAVLLKKENICITGQLGDGAVCLIKEDVAMKVPNISNVEKSGSNMTKTVFSSEAEKFFSINIFEKEMCDIIGILLTSDGLQNELYSEVGEIKNNLQWYFNTISLQPLEISKNKISERWNTIAEENEAEFSDDMSIAVIYQPNRKVALPEDANWLCLCGYRNNLESSRCNNCLKDFLRVYKGAPYKEHGGKKHFFLWLNENPDQEKEMLHRLCTYPIDEESSEQIKIPIIDLNSEESLPSFQQSVDNSISPAISACAEKETQDKDVAEKYGIDTKDKILLPPIPPKNNPTDSEAFDAVETEKNISNVSEMSASNMNDKQSHKKSKYIFKRDIADCKLKKFFSKIL